MLFPTGEESVKKIVTDGKHVVRELGKSEVNFLKCTVTPSFYVINQKQDNCSVLWNTFFQKKNRLSKVILQNVPIYWVK